MFTNEFGRYVSYRAIFDSFKRIVKRIGLPDARIHDLRHTYAVNCIRAGDDIKTVQSNLGHATAAFTLMSTVISQTTCARSARSVWKASLQTFSIYKGYDKG